MDSAGFSKLRPEGSILRDHGNAIQSMLNMSQIQCTITFLHAEQFKQQYFAGKFKTERVNVPACIFQREMHAVATWEGPACGSTEHSEAAARNSSTHSKPPFNPMHGSNAYQLHAIGLQKRAARAQGEFTVILK